MPTVLSVAYPLAAVGPNATGGAEQVLSQLDCALVAAGWNSLVIACHGSVTAGRLLPIPNPTAELDEGTQVTGQLAIRRAIGEALRDNDVDLIHLHGMDFTAYLPPAGPPVLVTLHLPAPWHPRQAFQVTRPRTFLNCVSAAQHRLCPATQMLLEPIDNGVPDELFQTQNARRHFALSLGRVCPEKGYHLAMDACREAHVPFILAGQVYRYAWHESYFKEEIVPRLSRECRFVGPASFQRKRRLLSSAKCLLVPSLAPETSSLVAMEALACGTPVIAFASGALPSLIEDGKTGFIVEDVQAMAKALRKVERLSAADCRRSAMSRFSAKRMCEKYFAVYRRLIEGDVGCQKKGE